MDWKTIFSAVASVTKTIAKLDEDLLIFLHFIGVIAWFVLKMHETDYEGKYVNCPQMARKSKEDCSIIHQGWLAKKGSLKSRTFYSYCETFLQSNFLPFCHFTT